MAKNRSYAQWKAARRARDDKRLGRSENDRDVERFLRGDAEIRNKERALLGKVLSSRVAKRGGLSKERTKEIDKLFQRGKILPVFEHEIAEEKRLREEAVNELNERLVKLEEASKMALTPAEEALVRNALSTLGLQAEPAPPGPELPKYLPCGKCQTGCTTLLAASPTSNEKPAVHSCQCVEGGWGREVGVKKMEDRWARRGEFRSDSVVGNLWKFMVKEKVRRAR